VTPPLIPAAIAGALLLAVAASAPAEYAHGQDVPKSGTARPIPYKEEPSFADQLVRVGLAFASVVVVGAIGIGGYRYLSGARPALSGRTGRRLIVVETLRLAPRTTLFLVEADGRTLLIGQHGDRLSLLVGPAESGSPGSRSGRGGGDESPG